jgi:hypothetical protein
MPRLVSEFQLNETDAPDQSKRSSLADFRTRPPGSGQRSQAPCEIQHVVPSVPVPSVPEERCPVRSTRVNTNARDLPGRMKGERKFQIS